MIQKHAIPILEFDDNPQAVLMPTHEGLDLKLPKKCIYAFLEEEIDRYAQEVERHFPLYRLGLHKYQWK